MYQLVESIIKTKKRSDVKPGCAYKSKVRKTVFIDQAEKPEWLICQLRKYMAYSEIVTDEKNWYYEIHEYTVEDYGTNRKFKKALYARSIRAFESDNEERTTIWAQKETY